MSSTTNLFPASTRRPACRVPAAISSRATTHPTATPTAASGHATNSPTSPPTTAAASGSSHSARPFPSPRIVSPALLDPHTAHVWKFGPPPSTRPSARPNSA